MEQNNKKQKENKGERKKFDFKKRFSEFRSKEFMKKYGASVYMSLALMVVVATAVGVFSLSYSYDDVGSIDIDVPDISIPDIDIPDFIPSQPEPEKPVDKPQSGIEEEPPVVKEYYFPVNGKIIKGLKCLCSGIKAPSLPKDKEKKQCLTSRRSKKIPRL